MDNQKLSGRVKLAGILAAFIAGLVPYAGGAQDKPAKGPAPLEMDNPAAPSPWKRYGNWPQTDWKEFNTLRTLASPPPAKFQKIDKLVQGDPEKGKKLVADRSRGGSCLACHVLPGATLPGNVAPDLSAVGSWGRTDEYLFDYIYDPRSVNPNSIMPPWGTHKIFTPDEIKDIVAYLNTLKGPTAFKDRLDDPAKRPLPQPTADYLDPTENPAMFELDRGNAIYHSKGRNGKACVDCHARPEVEFKNWAATMPRYEPRMKKVLNTEEFLTRHARATTGDDFPMQGEENTALSIYVRFFSHGQPINVQFKTPDEKAAAKRGEDLMYRKIGQLNLACTDCHRQGENKWIRGQFLTGSKGQVGRHPYWRTSQGEIWTLLKRFQWCGVAIRGNELPPDASEYGDLEYYLTSLSNGKKIDGPGIGH